MSKYMSDGQMALPIDTKIRDTTQEQVAKLVIDLGEECYDIHIRRLLCPEGKNPTWYVATSPDKDNFIMCWPDLWELINDLANGLTALKKAEVL